MPEGNKSAMLAARPLADRRASGIRRLEVFAVGAGLVRRFYQEQEVPHLPGRHAGFLHGGGAGAAAPASSAER